MYSGGPFVQELSIANFRCFESSTVTLRTPDGTAGSGLNLLVGNNGSGKTSVLDAFDYLFGGRYKAEHRLSIKDFSDFEKPMAITGSIDRFSVKSGFQHFRGKYFNCTGEEFSAEPRKSKQPGRLLSLPIAARSNLLLDEGIYYNESSGEAYVQKGTGDTRAVDPRERVLETDKVGPNGV